MALEIKLADLKSQLSETSARWSAESSVISLLSDKEKMLRLGAEHPDGAAGLKKRETQSVALFAKAAAVAPSMAPAHWDWRNVGGQNYVTPIRDQASCGSCVAFGSCATVEATARIELHQPTFAIDLSEAQLFYCDARSEGRTCATGWWPDHAFKFFVSDGIADEACYPYVPGDQNCTHLCTDWQARATKITAFHSISKIADMKAWLSTRGALSTCFTVYGDFFSYHTGVYHHVTGSVAGGHCVCVVGYDDVAGCWICKNSWGAGWGEAGFFRIGYGECGIDAEMWAVEGIVGAKAVLADTSRRTPALAALGGQVALAWAGTDSPSHVNVMTSPDGYHFGNKVVLGETCVDGPALAGGDGHLYVAWTGTDSDHHLNVLMSTDGRKFENKATLGETSHYGPALAYGNKRIYLGWVGTDSGRHLNIISSADGKKWDHKVTLNEASDSQFGLAWVGNKLVVVWQGTDSNSSLNLMESTDGVKWTNKITLGDSSDFTPAVVQGSKLVLGWTGRDSRHSLNTMTSTSGTHNFGQKIVYSDTATAGVSLVEHGGHTYIAWSGTDAQHHLNVMRLSI